MSSYVLRTSIISPNPQNHTHYGSKLVPIHKARQYSRRHASMKCCFLRSQHFGQCLGAKVCLYCSSQESSTWNPEPLTATQAMCCGHTDPIRSTQESKVPRDGVCRDSMMETASMALRISYTWVVGPCWLGFFSRKLWQSTAPGCLSMPETWPLSGSRPLLRQLLEYIVASSGRARSGTLKKADTST